MTSLLVLGGTHFVGHALAADAVARGWDVTTVHRGGSTAPEGAASLVLDRTEPGALADAIDGRTFDLVVDTWWGEPSVVERAIAELDGRVDRFAFVSTRSVYAWPAPDLADESAPVVDDPAPGEEPDYPQVKEASERAVLAAFGDRALISRAGVILGPCEVIGRLPWWLGRIARGGEVPAPGPPDLDLQFVDARDLATWILDVAPTTGGVVDVVGRPAMTTMREVLDLCREVTGSDAALRWIEPDDVIAAGVEPWTEVPLWLPRGPDHAAVHRGAAELAPTMGFTTRPVRETVADTWAWMQTDEGRSMLTDKPIGLEPDVEARLLASLRDS